TLAALVARWYARDYGSVRLVDACADRLLARTFGVRELARDADDGEIAAAAGADESPARAPKTHGMDALQPSTDADGNGEADTPRGKVPPAELAIVDLPHDAPTTLLDLVDLVLLVCEPDPMSLESWQAWHDAAAAQPDRILVVGNRVRDKYDVHLLRARTSEQLFTCYAFSELVQKARSPKLLDLDQLEFGNQEVLAIVTRFLRRRCLASDDKVISVSGAFGESPLGYGA